MSSEPKNKKGSFEKSDADAESSRLITPDPDCFSDVEDPVPAETGNAADDTSVADNMSAADNTSAKPSVPAELLYTETESADAENEDTDGDDAGFNDGDARTQGIAAALVRRRKRQRTTILLLLVLCAVLLVLLAVGMIFATSYHPTISTEVPFTVPTDDEPVFSVEETADADSDGIPDRLPEEPGDETIRILVDADYARREDVYNFLVLGVDRAANLSDVIMLVSFDVKEHDLHVVSLPRDTYINVGSNYHTVNAYFAASYNHSGKRDEARYTDAITSMKNFLEKGLCVKIDRYVCMDTAGFRDIVDAVGGVDMDVPFDMDYEDPEQDLFIHLKAGYQHLDGDKAEQFVRFRKAYLNGDIGRISAQRLFLTALAKTVKENLTVSTAASLAKTVFNYVTTDLTAAECVYFAKEALSVDLEKISFTTIPGGAAVNPETGTGYYVMFAETVRGIVNEKLNVYTKPISREVFLANSRYFTSTDEYISSVFLTSGVAADTATAETVNADRIRVR